MNLSFEIRGQTIALIEKPSLIVSGTYKYLSATFAFSQEWDGVTSKWAHFKRNKEVYDVLLVDDAIPAEFGLRLEAGSWSVYLHGVREQDGQLVRRITTDAAAFTVKQYSGDGLPMLPLTPDAQDLLLAQLSGAQDEIRQLQTQLGYAEDALRRLQAAQAEAEARIASKLYPIYIQNTKPGEQSLWIQPMPEKPVVLMIETAALTEDAEHRIDIEDVGELAWTNAVNSEAKLTNKTFWIEQ